MRLGLLMRRMDLDWTLSRRQRCIFGAPLQTWEQYSKLLELMDQASIFTLIENLAEAGLEP